MEEYVTVQQASEILNLTVRRVYSLIAEGKLVKHKQGSSTLLSLSQVNDLKNIRIVSNRGHQSLKEAQSQIFLLQETVENLKARVSMLETLLAPEPSRHAISSDQIEALKTQLEHWRGRVMPKKMIKAWVDDLSSIDDRSLLEIGLPLLYEFVSGLVDLIGVHDDPSLVWYLNRAKRLRKDVLSLAYLNDVDVNVDLYNLLWVIRGLRQQG